MNRCLNKNADFHRTDWISLLNSAGIRQKTTVTPENCNLYHYGGNNPVKYTDPDGEYINGLSIFLTQNSPDNRFLTMGFTLSGRKLSEDSPIYNRNLIGDFGCLFTATLNIADDIKRSTIQKYAPSVKLIPETRMSDWNNSDNYFSFSQFVDKGSYLENDANMGKAEMQNLISDISGLPMDKIHIAEITGSSKISSSIAKASMSSTKTYVVGHMGGHYFNITDYSISKGYKIHDVYHRFNDTIQKQFFNKVQSGGIDKIYMITIDD
ncbi:MAG: hypothetical protein IK015_01860 [Treponema sp.]|nr:hypothetical protein [Treponema sp.]